jgi:vacuolar-type H+-ATPase subunit C/Vma6
MNGTTTQTRSKYPATPATDWSYVSGRISVLETLHLNRNFFEGLLKSRSLSEARSALAKTQYRQLFTSDESIRDYANALGTYSNTVIEGIIHDSPPHVIASFFDVNRRYIVFRTLFLRVSARGASTAELENTFDTLFESPHEAEALTAHTAMLRHREGPQTADAVAKSLFLDSAVCTLRLHLALSSPEKTVSNLLHTMAVLQTWTAVLRSRWNGTPAEVIERWFIVPSAYTRMIMDTALLAESNPADALAGKVSDAVLRTLRSAGGANLRQNVDAYTQEAVRNEILEYRGIPYGPEKVLVYLAGYTVEQENLRLALAAIVNGIDSKVALATLRREYA